MDCLSHLSSLARQAISGSDGPIRLQNHPFNGSDGPVDILALGSGWTWSFLGPAAGEMGLRTAFTTRDGRNGSVPFTFDPESDDTGPFASLPDAHTIVIIFPLYSPEAARRLVHGYVSTRSEAAVDGMKGDMTDEKHNQSKFDSSRTRFILLGSAGIWRHSGPTLQFAPLSADGPQTCHLSLSSFQQSHGMKHKPSPPQQPDSPWIDRHSEVDKVPRALAEDALLALNEAKDPVPTSVLCLSGLWGHGRSPRRYVNAIAPTKERLAQLSSVHLVHGHDVARAVLAMHKQWSRAVGQRWLLTNERVYDLWDLISQWGNAGDAGRNHIPQGTQPRWVQELMAESRQKKAGKPYAPIRGLPRTPEQLGLAMDSSDFWTTFEMCPEVPWVD